MPISNIPITHNTPLSDLIIYTQTEIQNLLSGEEFMVKDLFLGYEWNRIELSEKKPPVLPSRDS